VRFRKTEGANERIPQLRHLPVDPSSGATVAVAEWRVLRLPTAHAETIPADSLARGEAEFGAGLAGVVVGPDGLRLR
jgi:hypothetical protein